MEFSIHLFPAILRLPVAVSLAEQDKTLLLDNPIRITL
jgi:hypothetical protein